MLLVAMLSGCGISSPVPSPSATGVVISVEGPSAAEVERFSLRTSDGTFFEFTVGVLDVTNGGLTAPHLREHLVSGDPITVEYMITRVGQNVATRYVDAE